MVFYRKYRPQKIEELDNDTVRESLYSIFSKGSSVHAFLFTGPKGLGKTSTARIVAKVINCEKHKGLKGLRSEKEIEPDNKCEQCISITNGNNLDVLEIDGASNRGIDEIRDLREKIKLSPFKALRKVYIIDEVHMLTTEAFNALLKTLEEPPAHAVFILCTTEPQKVPATIASRCFRINFTRAKEEELVRSLNRIVKAEGIKIDKEALYEIAALSDGSFRDGAKILEEVYTFAGRKSVTKDLVNEKYNTVGIGESVSKMLDVFSEKDVKKGLLLCRELANQGMDFKFFIESLIDRLHFLLLQEVGVEKALQGDALLSLSVGDMKRLFELLSDAYSQTKYSVLPQMPLELVILEWTGNESLRSPSEFDESSNASVPAELGTRPPSAALAKTSYHQKSPRDSDVNIFFNNFIDEVKKHNNLLAGVLRSCSAEEIKNGQLNIVARSKFHKEKLEETKNLKLIEDVLENLLNKKINVKILLGPA